jgi:hypothetical protein
MTHLLLFGFSFSLGGFTNYPGISRIQQGAEILKHARTARIASSKTFFNPFWVRAEHSKYFTAPISFAMLAPWVY